MNWLGRTNVFIHLVVCLTTGPKPLPKRALHIMWSRASYVFFLVTNVYARKI